MRTTAFRLCKHPHVLAALLCGAAFNTHAQHWVTVYNSKLDPALENSHAASADIVTDPDGTIYSVGRAIPIGAPTNEATVLVSRDQGFTWDILKAYTHPDFPPRAYYRAFAADSSGRELCCDRPRRQCLGRRPRCPAQQSCSPPQQQPWRHSLELQAEP